MFNRTWRLTFCLLIAAGAAFADNMTWASAGNNIWSIFYIGPYSADDTSRANLPVTLFCLDYNHEIAPPNDWQANYTALVASPSDPSANLGQLQFGGNYPNVQPGPGPNATEASAFAFQSEQYTDNSSTVKADLSTSDAWDRYLEAAWLFTQIEDALTDKSGGSINQSQLNTAAIVYQVAAWRIFIDTEKSDFSSLSNFDDLNTRIGQTGGAYQYNASLGLWMPGGGGDFDFRYAVDSALASAENAVVNQDWLPASAWTVVTGDSAWVAQNNGGVPVQEFLSPMTAPTPEPSSLIMLATMIGLTAFAVRKFGKRSA